MFAVFYKDEDGKMTIDLTDTEEGVAIIRNYLSRDGINVVAIPVKLNNDYVWMMNTGE